MKNRSSYAVLTRFGIIAAVLATLVLIAPVVSAADPLKFSYNENGKDPVATFTASDPDADADGIVWSLKGVDKDDFEIEGGVLTFKKSPNYESPTDRDEDPDTSVEEGKGDRKYQVTVVASGGEQAVEVEVININEPGSVNFDQLQAQETRSLKASFSDDDGKVDPSWQWSRCTSAEEGDCTPIDGATSTDRTPSEDDIGNWLRATVSYTDSFSATSASAAIGPVVGETLANSAPSFSGLDEDNITANVQVTRSIAENKKGALGDPITATDGEDDPRLYTLGGTDKDCFSIGETSGQLSLSSERDYESPLTACKEGGAARTATSADTNAANSVYTVVVTATDPSGATGNATVKVTVTDANEAPEFTAAAKADAQKKLYIDEIEVAVDSGPLSLRTTKADPGDTSAAPDDYEATDEDRAANGTTPVDTITYKVEGPDAKHFTIGGADGTEDTLEIATGEDLLGTDGANFEGKPSYSITIVATSTGTADGDTDPTTPVRGKTLATLNVTIEVVDREDPGKVTFPTVREPQEGKPVLAKLEDPDGGEVGVKWQWYRGVVDSDAAADGIQVACPAMGAAVLTTPGVDGWQIISGADTALYTPGSDTFDHDGDAIADGAVNPAASPEVGYCLRATATYRDDIVTPDDDSTADVDESIDVAHGVTERPVQEDDPANTAPEFARDQDPSTPGNQAVAERTVAENAKGVNVGDPVVAADADLLVYAISDTTNFSVSNSGQIKTKVELDYESLPEGAKYHMVELTATDPSRASDSVMVKINVTDEDDKPIITLGSAPAPPAPDSECVTGGAVADANNGGLTSDCEILLAGMAELRGDGTATLNWSADTPIGDWDGVATGIGRVYRIWLPGGHDNLGGGVLAGTIPDSFNDLDALERLTLRDNDLTGEIPDLSDLDNLEWLVLQDNSLSGNLPATLGDMDSLDYLHLKNNGFSGEIPTGLAGVMTLRRVDLRGNDLTGSVPAEFGDIDRLRYLMLSDNDLSGSIPVGLGSSANMVLLYLSDNGLAGSIPPELGSISGLRRLQLHNNALTGDVPAELGDLSELTNLSLSGNMLTGCVPAAIYDALADAADTGLDACPPPADES